MSQLLDKAKNFVAEKVANIKKPEANLDDVDFKDVSREGVTYNAKVSVSNPYGTAIPICEISYTFKSADRFDLDSLFLPLFFLRSAQRRRVVSSLCCFAPCFLGRGLTCNVFQNGVV